MTLPVVRFVLTEITAHRGLDFAQMHAAVAHAFNQHTDGFI